MTDLAPPQTGSGSTDVFADTRRVQSWHKVDDSTFINDIANVHQPAVLRRQVSDWPCVIAAQTSSEDLLRYLPRFETGARAELFVGTAEMNGRFFYDNDISAFNFSKAQAPVHKLSGR